MDEITGGVPQPSRETVEAAVFPPNSATSWGW